MVEAGHAGAADYGFSFFLDAVSEHERIVQEKLVLAAYAARVGTNADEKVWKQFLRSCGIKRQAKPATMMPEVIAAKRRRQLGKRPKHGDK